MRKSNLLTIPLLICIAICPLYAHIQKNDGFAQFFANFQNAVKAGDKDKVADMIDFGDFTWEATPALQAVKTRESFLKNYDKMFTVTIKAKIATSKTETTDGNYFIIWRTTNSEYSLYFGHQFDGGYKFEGLTVGPR